MAGSAGTLITTGVAIGVSAQEIANIAIANANAHVSWTTDGCAAFVWGVTNLAGLPFFDPHSGPVDYTYQSNPRTPQDTAYSVPHLNPSSGSGTADLSNDGWTAVWTGSSMSALRLQLQVGDVVRFYKYGDTSESSGTSSSPQAHSFIVASVNGNSIMVVDNWSGPQIGQHSFDDFASWAVGGNFQSAIVSRINTDFVNSNVPQTLQGWGIGDWSGIGGASNHAPVVTVHDASVGANQSISGSSLITSVTDQDGDSVTQYGFWDGGSGGGYFTVNGAVQASGQWIYVSAANLGTIKYVGGTSAGGETLFVTAYDGTDWSAAAPLTATTVSASIPIPVIAVQDQTVLANTSMAASSLILSVTDPNNYAITQYGFRDDGADGGYFSLNGVTQASANWIVVSSSDLSKLLYFGGATAGSETVDVAAWDGFNWSYYQTATITTKAVSLPIIAVQNATVDANASMQASTLISSVSDPNNYPITFYDFRDDGAGGGHFSLNGVIQASGSWITVSSSDLSKLLYVGGPTAGSETVDVAAWDSFNWSYYQTAIITTKAVSLPVITVQNATVNASATIEASSLISSVNDPNNYAITSYEFRDNGSGGGHFSLNGITQGSGNWITVSSSDLSRLFYVGGSAAGSETIDVAAYDGHQWSNYATATVTTIGVTPVNPVINLLHDAGIKADVAANLANNSLSYSGMLTILKDVALGGVTDTEFSDLRQLVNWFNKSNGITVSAYVYDISNKLINGDSANAHWTGGALTSVALGDLASGSSEAQMNKLIAKWFLGGDLPAPRFDTDPGSVVYLNDTNPLFNSTGLPSVGDVNQSPYLGDCYLLASLVGIATFQPSVITSMLIDNRNGTYGVEFYIQNKPTFVTVNTVLPYTSDGLPAGNRATATWASLIEKAYVQLNEEGVLPRAAGNSYTLISGGWSDPITEITGRSVITYSSSSYASASAWSSLKQTIASAILNGQEVDLATSASGESSIGGKQAFVHNHMYAGIGYDAGTGEFIVRNPWGNASADGWAIQNWLTQFEATMDDFRSVGGTLFVATGGSSSGGVASATPQQFDIPITHNDAYVILKGQSLSVDVSIGVLANDDASSSLGASILSSTTHGSAQLSNDGSFSYTPAVGFSGIDSFTYRATDAAGNTDDATGFIYVVPVATGATTTTLSLLALTAEQQIAATYTAFFGRAADAVGFEFWANQFVIGLPKQGAGALFANIASSFGVSDEAKSLYPFLVHPFGSGDAQITSFLDSVYNNLFNRSSDAGGLAYWTGQVKTALATGQFVGSVLIDIMSGAQSTDITTLMGKVAVSLEYVHEQERHGTAWGATDNATATALLHGVTSDPQTVLAGIKNADGLIAGHA